MLDVRGKENLKRLAKIHLDRYTRQLRLALDRTPGFDVHENAWLLMIWENVRDLGFDWEQLGYKERTQINEAIEAGE